MNLWHSRWVPHPLWHGSNPGYYFPIRWLPLSLAAHSPVPWMRQQRSGSPVASCTAQGTRRSLPCSCSPQWGISVEKGYLGSELCHLEGGVTRVKLNCSLTFSSVSNGSFLLHGCAGTLPLDSWTSQRHSHLWASVQVSALQGLLALTQRDCIGSQATPGPKAVTKVFLTITWLTSGRDDSWILRSSGAGSQSSRKVTFVCGSMPNYCCQRRRIWQGVSY